MVIFKNKPINNHLFILMEKNRSELSIDVFLSGDISKYALPLIHLIT